MANGDITLEIKLSGTLTSGDPIRTFYESQTFSSTADIIDRTLTVPTSEVTVVAVGTVAGSTLGSLNGLIVNNNDSTNFITVGIKAAGAKSTYYKVEAGEQFVFQSSQLDCDDDTGAAFSAFTTIDTITLQADTSAVITQVVAW